MLKGGLLLLPSLLIAQPDTSGGANADNSQHSKELTTVQGRVSRSSEDFMDKREINSPKLTANFLFWVCGFGGLLLLIFLAHFVWRIL